MEYLQDIESPERTDLDYSEWGILMNDTLSPEENAKRAGDLAEEILGKAGTETMETLEKWQRVSEIALGTDYDKRMPPYFSYNVGRQIIYRALLPYIKQRTDLSEEEKQVLQSFFQPTLYFVEGPTASKIFERMNRQEPKFNYEEQERRYKENYDQIEVRCREELGKIRQWPAERRETIGRAADELVNIWNNFRGERSVTDSQAYRMKEKIGRRDFLNNALANLANQPLLLVLAENKEQIPDSKVTFEELFLEDDSSSD